MAFCLLLSSSHSFVLTCHHTRIETNYSWNHEGLFERFSILICSKYRFYLRYLSIEIPFQTYNSWLTIFHSWNNIVCAKLMCTFLCSEIVIQILQRPQMNGLQSQNVAFSHQYKKWNVRRTMWLGVNNVVLFCHGSCLIGEYNLGCFLFSYLSRTLWK